MDQVLSTTMYWANVDDDKKHIQYICRVMCCANLSETPSPWKGPVSRSFLAFNSMATEVQRNIRNLLEMTLLAMCVHGDVDRLTKKTYDWTRLGLMYSSSLDLTNNYRLPFGTELNTGLAMLMRCKIEQAVCKKRNEGYSVAKDLYLIDSSSLDFVNNPEEEISRAHLLWDSVHYELTRLIIVRTSS